jgi:hypothetical protein
MYRLFAVLAAFAMAFAAGACGDDGQGESGGGSDEFLTQLNSICQDSTDEVIQANLDLGYSTDPKDQDELGSRIIEIREESTAEIEALEPPEEDAAAFEDLLAAREDLIKAGTEQRAAIKGGDEAQIQKAVAATEKAGDSEDEAAAALGADICDGELPEADAQAAEDALREFATTSDPATSCEYESPDALVSEPYVEEGFGGIEQCEKEQQRLEENPDELAKDIEVESAEGVDGTAATLTYEDVGGQYDGIPTEATLYFLDGGWRLFSVRPLE